MINTRETDYDIDTILEITDEVFHDYKIGTKVKVINKDLNSYHVVNIEGEKRFWWVNEWQVKEIK